MAHALWTAEELADAAERIRAGASVRDVAASYGRDRTRLARLLARHGLTRPQNGSWARTLTVPDDPGVLGYIAGIIDGEGSIMFSRGRWWQVKVGMTDRPVIEWLASFGGTFAVQPRIPNRKEAYHWVVARRQDVHHLLTMLLPHLRVKRHLAEQAIAWCERP